MKAYMGGGTGGGGSYTAGTGIDITGNVISATGAATGQFNYFLFGQNKTTLPTPITASVRNLEIQYTSLTAITGAIKEADILSIYDNPLLETISLTTLESAYNLQVIGNAAIQSVSLSGLKYLSKCSISTNALLTSINLILLENANRLTIEGNDIIESVSISALANAQVINIITNASLDTITANANLTCPNQDYSGNALLESVVDNLLDIADDSGISNGTIDLSGGTNAAPSVAGLASKTSLEGKGWTVTVN